MLTTIILVPTLLYSVTQSYRLFRTQLQDRGLSIVRSLLPLAALAFVCSFSSLTYYTFVARAVWAAQATQNPRLTALLETVEALKRVQSRVGKLDEAHPLQLTAEDLSRASTLSKSTRQLLGDSHITLSLDAPPHHAHFGCPGNGQPEGLSARRDSWYSATIPLADGSSFFVAFNPVPYELITAGICKGQASALPARVP